MAKPSCPKCHRNGTYSEKFGQCTACRYGMVAQVVTPWADGGRPLHLKRERVTRPSTETKTVTNVPPETPLRYVSVQNWSVTGSVKPVPGEKCPTCGRKVPLSGKQRLAAMRERNRLKREAQAAEGE